MLNQLAPFQIGRILLIRKIAVITGGVVVGLIAAVLIIPRVIDWNMFKPRIAAEVRDATGRDFQIDGDLTVTVIPGLEFSAKGVRLANTAGAKTPEMARIASVDGKIELLPLLSGTLVVDRLTVRDPKIHLQVDRAGRANWEMRPAKPGGASSGEGAESALKNIRLDNFRVEGGKFTYSNAVSGQELTGRDVNVTAAMPDPSQPVSAKVSLLLNKEPTTLDVSLKTPEAILQGKPATMAAVLNNKHINFRLESKAAKGTASGFAGTFNLDVPSVGQLAAWLGQPLERGQPDPGPLKLHVAFDATRTGLQLKTATIEGSGLRATASGTVETEDGALHKLVLKLNGGVLDLDHYLPKTAIRPAVARDGPRAGEGNPLAMLSDKKFDLKALRDKDIDVAVNLQGVKAFGVDVGRIDVAAKMNHGKLDAAIHDVELYGGKIAGSAELDATRDALAVDTSLAIDKVNVGALARATAAGQPPIAGVVSATLAAKGRGASPRALAQSLVGNLEVDLGGAAHGHAATKVSALKLAIALPGIDKEPTIKASAVYNGQKVTLDVVGDTTRKLLGSDRFRLTAALDHAARDGALRRRGHPPPDTGARREVRLGRRVGREPAELARNAAGAGSTGPGSLNITAQMSTDSGKAMLKEARIEGKAIKATATGSLAGTKSGLVFDARIDVSDANLNAYLPAEETLPAEGTQPRRSARPRAPQPHAAAGWSDAPIAVALPPRSVGRSTSGSRRSAIATWSSTAAAPKLRSPAMR